MRVVECNECGELVTAADGRELARRLLEHLEHAHPDAAAGEEDARRAVERESYEATDA
jgi:predicted small metal-binding protein